MEGFALTKQHISMLRLAHKSASNKKNAYRINSVILLGTGWTVAEVSQALLLDEETLRKYVNKYQFGGLDGLLSDEYNFKGREPKLDDISLKELFEHLATTLYRRTLDIINYVKDKYKVQYSRSGMNALLIKNGFSYKKPKQIPEKLDPQAQAEFIEYLSSFVEKKSKDEAVLFYDATHPNYGSVADYGWIKKGEDSLLPTPPSRKRLNITGVIDIEHLDVTVDFPEKVNSDTTLEFFKNIKEKYQYASKIHIVLDNASYNHSAKVKEYARKNKINLVFLPPYSPNLNVIERLWGLLRRKVLANRYFENFAEFKKAIRYFLKNKIKKIKHELESLMVLDFQEFDLQGGP